MGGGVREDERDGGGGVGGGVEGDGRGGWSGEVGV